MIAWTGEAGRYKLQLQSPALLPECLILCESDVRASTINLSVLWNFSRHARNFWVNRAHTSLCARGGRSLRSHPASGCNASISQAWRWRGYKGGLSWPGQSWQLAQKDGMSRRICSHGSMDGTERSAWLCSDSRDPA